MNQCPKCKSILNNDEKASGKEKKAKNQPER